MKIKIFTTPWCSHCKPYIEQARQLIDDKIELEIVDASQLDQEKIQELGVYSVPLTIVEEDGEEIDRWNGNRTSKLMEYVQN